jgi:hypothetical protein
MAIKSSTFLQTNPRKSLANIEAYEQKEKKNLEMGSFEVI